MDHKLNTVNFDNDDWKVVHLDDAYIVDGDNLTPKTKFGILGIVTLMGTLSSLATLAFSSSTSLYEEGGIAFVILLGLAGIAALPFALNNARRLAVRKRVENGETVPDWALSSHNHFGLQVCLLMRKVNKLIRRWNRYRSLCEAGYCEPMENEEEALQHLKDLREETARHRRAAHVFITMCEEGDFDEISAQDLVCVQLEAVRATQERLQRQLNGITNHLSAPLHAEIQAAALDKELQEGVVKGAAASAKKQLTGALSQKAHQ